VGRKEEGSRELKVEGRKKGRKERKERKVGAMDGN
jgi:hypothetical protein